MRRLLGLLVVSAAIAGLVPAAAPASHSNGQGPAKDFVTGTLKLPLPTPLGSYPGQVHTNASSDAAAGPGMPADGHFYMDIFDTPAGTVNLSGDIVCLSAVANEAWMRAVVVDSNTDLAPPGFGVLSKVVDNGESTDDLPDAAGSYLTPPPGPNLSCPSVPFAVEQATAGSTTVHDGV